VHLLRRVITPLRSANTYRRWVHLVLGGVLFLPVLLAVLVLLTLADSDAVGNSEALIGSRGALGVGVAAAIAATAVRLPGVRAQQLQLARSLVGGAIADAPELTPVGPARVREGVWLASHLVLGLAVSFVTMLVLTEAALLAITVVDAEPGTMVGAYPWSDGGTTRWLAPLAGAALVIGLVLLVAALGAAAARLAPVLLGPSIADRLAAAEARADRLTSRGQLAAELHDSIGHALSVVALQAGTAERLLESDPAFARTALGAIAEQARSAAAELDHVLGALRDERVTAAPGRSLAQLPDLLEHARTAGADVRHAVRGPLDRVPPVLSREAYRVCQEGLTNALRHGEDGAEIGVDVEVDDDRLRVHISNPTAGRVRARLGGGHGLSQLRERVRALGGSLETDVRGGAWHLEATLPLGGAP
jgi:signal transduction histidine kinase